MFNSHSFQFLNATMLMLGLAFSLTACQPDATPSPSTGEKQSLVHLMSTSVGVTEQCVGRVKEFPWGIKKQDCEHECPEGKKCEWQSSTDGKGTEHQWCGCSATEPDNCHLYIEIPKDGSAKDACTGNCASDEDCVRQETRKGDVTDINCACVKKKKKTTK